jgi:hypothetical protein
MLNISEYKTKDIYLASTLIAFGYKSYRIEKNGRQCFFIFDPAMYNLAPKDYDPLAFLEIQVDEYWGGNLLLDPKEVFNAFKELKSRMYEEDQR